MKARLGIYLLCGSVFASQPAGADVITDWSVRAGDIAIAAKLSPPLATRLMAIVQSAVYEAVNAITRRYPSNRVDLDAAPGASVAAAVAAANRSTLSRLVPSQKAAIDAAYETALAGVPDGPAKVQGIAVGEKAAAAILALRTDDGADCARKLSAAYHPWRLCADGPAGGPALAPAQAVVDGKSRPIPPGATACPRQRTLGAGL